MALRSHLLILAATCQKSPRTGWIAGLLICLFAILFVTFLWNFSLQLLFAFRLQSEVLILFRTQSFELVKVKVVSPNLWVRIATLAIKQFDQNRFLWFAPDGIQIHPFDGIIIDASLGSSLCSFSFKGSKLCGAFKIESWLRSNAFEHLSSKSKGSIWFLYPFLSISINKQNVHVNIERVRDVLSWALSAPSLENLQAFECPSAVSIRAFHWKFFLGAFLRAFLRCFLHFPWEPSDAFEF